MTELKLELITSQTREEIVTGKVDSLRNQLRSLEYGSEEYVKVLGEYCHILKLQKIEEGC